MKAGLASPVTCSTPTGPVGSLPSVKEKSLRKRKEPKKQDDNQLIIVCTDSVYESIHGD